MPDHLREVVSGLEQKGARIVCGGVPVAGSSFQFANTLLTVSGSKFLQSPRDLQTEAFGPVSLFVQSRDLSQTVEILKQVEGNLTGTIYLSEGDESEYAQIEPVLRRRVGRLLNNRMPTGVAVSPGMNHGGPFPATGHPLFTAVGFPASIERFTALHCYEHVDEGRLPAWLQR